MHQLLTDIAEEYKLRRRSGKWTGPCPECGGSAKTDRFNIRDDGGFKCYACSFKGDFITWLMKKEGMSCPEAHEAAEKNCLNSLCPVWSGCRMGDGKGRQKFRPRSVTPRVKQTQQLPEPTVTDPREKWMVWALDLVKKAEEQLQDRSEDLAWLEKRGIDSNAVRRFRLGWLQRNSKVDRGDIGLGPREDGKLHLWVPDGLVIPIFTADDCIHRLRVRRPGVSRERFLPDLKYVWLEGAGTAPMVIRPQSGKSRGAVIVEAELDAMAVAAAHPQVTVVALGTVRGGLPADLREEVAALPVILVSLDADPGKDGKTGAGPDAIKAWLQEYRQAKFWPVPKGKDPGHYAELGGSLHGWIDAGLIPEVPIPAPNHEQILSSDCIPSGEGGEEKDSNALIESGGKPPQVRTITLKNGREFSVVDDQPTWNELVKEGSVVFSENEMRRLQQATLNMSREETLTAAMLVLDIKEVFGHAYIRRGDTVEDAVSI